MSHLSATSARLHGAPPDLSDLGLSWPSTPAEAIWRGVVAVLLIAVIVAATMSLISHHRQQVAAEQDGPMDHGADDSREEPEEAGSASRERTERRLRRALITMVIICAACLALGLVLDQVAGLSPEPVRPQGWYRPTASDLTAADNAAALATVLLWIVLPPLALFTAIIAAAERITHRRR